MLYFHFKRLFISKKTFLKMNGTLNQSTVAKEYDFKKPEIN